VYTLLLFIVADYYLVRRQHLDLQQLFSAEPGTRTHYDGGWKRKAMIAFGIASVSSVASVWSPALSSLSGYSRIFGAILGALLHYLLMRKHCVAKGSSAPAGSPSGGITFAKPRAQARRPFAKELPPSACPELPRTTAVAS
jgi:cytosine/uracil/thiamine/allantoin permease